MTDKTIPFIPPFPHQRESERTVDPAEFLALRTLVQVLVTDYAVQNQVTHGIEPNAFINELSAHCQEALLAGKIGIEDPDARERFRRTTLDWVNRILGQIHFSKKHNAHDN